MEKELIQKKRLNLRKYTLLEDRLLIEFKDHNALRKFSVTLEDVGTNIEYHKESKRQYIVGAAFLGALIFANFIFFLLGKLESAPFWIMAFMLSIMICLTLLKQSKDDIFLTGGKSNLIFYRTKPSEEKVLEFIDHIISTRKAYFISTYTVFDKNTTEDDFYYRLNWLKHIKIISEEEHEDLANGFKIQKLL